MLGKYTMVNMGSREQFRQVGWVAFLIAISAYCLYGNTFDSSWTYDDLTVIVENPDVLSIRGFFEDTYPVRPLRELTYLFDHAIFGLNPAGWHIQNIFWHGLNAFLVFLLVQRLKGGRAAAWIASLLFLAHPICVEVVANISHRKDSLALAFSLLSVHSFIFACEKGSSRVIWGIVAFFFGGLAFLSKEHAVVLPIVFLAYEWSCLPRERWWLLKRWRSFLVVGSGGIVVFLCWLAFGGGGQKFLTTAEAVLAHKLNYYGPVTVAGYYAVVLKSWAFSFLRLIWPFDLAVEYLYPVPTSWIDPWVFSALIGISVVGGGLYFFRRRSPLVFFSLAWMVLFFIPVSNIWPMAYFAADRYLYAASVTFFILTAVLVCRIAKGAFLRTVLVILLVSVLSVLTWQQNQVWTSEESLWLNALKVSPRSAFVLNELGKLYLAKGEKAKSLGYYVRAAENNPNNAAVQYNLGGIYEADGLFGRAFFHYRNFLQLDDPGYRSAATELRKRIYNQYGIALD